MCFQKNSIETKFTKPFTLLPPGMFNIINYTTHTKKTKRIFYFFLLLFELKLTQKGLVFVAGASFVFLSFPHTAVQSFP